MHRMRSGGRLRRESLLIAEAPTKSNTPGRSQMGSSMEYGVWSEVPIRIDSGRSQRRKVIMIFRGNNKALIEIIII